MSQDLVRLHLTNIAGLGAVQLIKSLLPALEQNKPVRVVEVYLPNRGDLSSYQSADTSLKTTQYRRYLPNALSRLAECTVLGRRFSGELPLLVMGDLPIRCNARQTVFVQTPHLVRPEKFSWRLAKLKLSLLRWVFRSNLEYAQAFIVQTSSMRDALIKSYPSLHSRVYVVAQPVPAWLLTAGLQRTGRTKAPDAPLHLIYPAAGYPHKNHKLLATLHGNNPANWPIVHLDITLDEKSNPAPNLAQLRCLGTLSASQMVNAYSTVDALLFLSTDESYGFPLVEAMFVGLPIICPDLPYARVLCGDEATYFDVDNADSLKDAVNELHRKLSTGYWPDWSEQLRVIPKDWETVARTMLDIAAQPSAGATNELNARKD
ncbi:glycosyltransferase [Pseudomonas sp. 18175]|uniref:glycosyltransferase n=1 Tax=Pseudomonas sp. 18175 TaxID=3390056 RepID=UPI003D23F79B